MRKISLIGFVGMLAILLGSCSGEESPPSPTAATPSPTPVASPAATPTTATKIQPSFNTPVVARQPGTEVPINGLIQSTNSDQRSVGIQKGRKDPFAVIPVQPILTVEPTDTPPAGSPSAGPGPVTTPRRVPPVPRIPQQPKVNRQTTGKTSAQTRKNISSPSSRTPKAGVPSRSRPSTTSQPTIARRSGTSNPRVIARRPGTSNPRVIARRPGTSNPRVIARRPGTLNPRVIAKAPNNAKKSPSKTTIAARPITPPPISPPSLAAGPQIFRPELPQLPDPALARGVEVSGVIQVGNVAQAIVKAPNETTSRYVSPGERLSNGQVLVKRIEMTDASSPVVILEQYGVEVAKRVGEKVAPTDPTQPGAPTAALPPAQG
ncbi:hypothetical protein H6F77_00890 [Microcoleus sp. FACHB-831]|uniref:hypothetical protein n=1 Tax=Microcoleus sp. FACHB-831 TaxID=2692827 RepID=UPI0016863575|nr:hypothetical protein [Microcoleus sp. FACHB-831]MBD1919679.1 hypothetical protein [Microcoleus sp. FACHB-831]